MSPVKHAVKTDDVQLDVDERVVLPPDIIPLRYDVKLIPDLGRFTFAGEQTVEVDVKVPTNKISFNTRDLYLKTVKLTDSKGKEHDSIKFEYLKSEHKFTATFEENLAAGKGKLFIIFDGELNDQMAGFYRSSYETIDKKKKFMASTQFEAIDARRAFPCWDEPARKAIFGVTLVVDPDLTAFSNMPEKTTKLVKVDVGGEKVQKREIVFMDSPLMSTYLLAFIVGEFDFVSAVTENGVIIRCYTPPGRAQDGKFALECAVKCLDLYDDYFGIPYPLPKCDMVAIPEFAAGAMENWGCVTYREVDLLIGSTASPQQKQRVATVVNHELAHQWFGNLVTMDWWNDLWLNEGFASWCENFATDLIYPQYMMWEQFVGDTQAYGMGLDCLKSSHPIQVPINNALEVEEVFDAISYCKGCSVIYMAQNVIGMKDFQQGLQDYMQKHQYSNTTTLDLWNAWGDASGKDIKGLMGSWTEQMGFPLLTIESIKPKGDGKATLHLKQQWFLADGSGPKEDPDKHWVIPIFVTVNGKKQPMHFFKGKTGGVDIEYASGDWVKVNSGHFVPLRCLYPADLLGQLEAAVKQRELGEIDRAGLLSDSYALVKSAQLPKVCELAVPAGKIFPFTPAWTGRLGFRSTCDMKIDDLSRLIAACYGDQSYIVWDVIEPILVGLHKVFLGQAEDGNADTLDAYERFCSKFATPTVNYVGWDVKQDDKHLDRFLRATMIRAMANFMSNDPEVIGEAKRRYEAWKADHKTPLLPEDYQHSVFGLVAKSGGADEFEDLIAVWKSADNDVLRKNVYRSIGACPTKELKEKAMDWAISGEVKLQDFFYIFGSVGGSKGGNVIAWEYFRDHFDEINKMVANCGAGMMDACINCCCKGFNSQKKHDEVKAFLEPKDLPQQQRTIAQALEAIRNNTKFRDTVLKTEAKNPAFWDNLLAGAPSPRGAKATNQGLPTMKKNAVATSPRRV
eukprot:gene414-1080_t